MATLTVKISAQLGREIAAAARGQRITKSELARRAMIKYVAEADKARTFQSASDLAGELIGSVRHGPADLASNPDHFDGYGK
jgi:predicted transcriptional regulator